MRAVFVHKKRQIALRIQQRVRHRVRSFKQLQTVPVRSRQSIAEYLKRNKQNGSNMFRYGCTYRYVWILLDVTVRVNLLKHVVELACQ